MSAPSLRQSSLSKMDHLVRRLVPLLVLVGVLAAAYYFLGAEDQAPQHEPVTPSAPIPVQVITTQEETVPLGLRFLGQTEASQVVEVRARVAGHIIDRNFQEGQLVEAGQTLFQIDPRPVEVELLQAQARLQNAEAVLQQAQISMLRQEELRKTRTTSQQEVDDAQAIRDVASANVQLQKAEIAAAELELDYTTIKSPITGRIGQALVDVGNFVTSGGSQSLATVQKVDPMYVRFPVTEGEVLRFRRQVSEGGVVAPPTEDMELEITLSDGSTYLHRGRINFQDVKIDQSTGTMVVRGTVPNQEGLLIPGQFIHTTIMGPQRADIIRIPQNAVLQSPVGANVYVVNSENQVESRPVKLGQWSGNDLWIIEEGLKPGEQVIVDRLLMLSSGTPVIPNAAGEPGQLTSPTGEAPEGQVSKEQASQAR